MARKITQKPSSPVSEKPFISVFLTKTLPGEIFIKWAGFFFMLFILSRRTVSPERDWTLQDKLKLPYKLHQTLCHGKLQLPVHYAPLVSNN